MISEEEVPDHWEVKKLGEVTEIILGNSPPGDSYNKNEEGPPFIQGATVFGDKYPETERFTSEPSKLCEEGDTLIANRATIGDLNKADRQYCLGRGVAAVRVKKEVTQEYVHKYLEAVNQVNYWEEVSTGATFNSITKTNIQELDIPVPPFDEQKQIAQLLDDRLDRIDRLAKSVEQIHVYTNEYENSLLAFLFAGKENMSEGSVSTLPSKEEIPPNWEIKTLGEIATFQNGNDFSKDQWEDEGLPIIRIQNLTGTGDSYNYYSGEVHERYKVENGDILFSWSGTIDAFKWGGDDAWLNQHIYRVDYCEKVQKDYIFHLLKRSASILEKKKIGGALQHIRKSDVTELEVPIPPLKEQNEIVDRIESVDLNRVSRAVQDIDELLEEYRNSVLAHALTQEPQQ